MPTTTTPIDSLIAGLAAIGVTDPDVALAADPDVTFADLDVDSLGIIEVIARLEADCGVVVPDDDLARFARPSDLVAFAATSSEAA